jgi:hypothetical protein
MRVPQTSPESVHVYEGATIMTEREELLDNGTDKKVVPVATFPFHYYYPHAAPFNIRRSNELTRTVERSLGSSGHHISSHAAHDWPRICVI